MRGLVLGKFLPPHLGHEYLFQFARRACDHLDIVVASLATESIPGSMRYGWVQELAPWARVWHLTDELPSYPHEHPDFWALWTASLNRLLPEPPALIFSSEDYGEELARQLGAEHVPVDPARSRFPISGEQARQNPWKCWDYLPPCVRAHYALRVALVGPESTGKTTLAESLAGRFKTTWAPEYARFYLDWRNARRPVEGICCPEDIPFIARGQLASEEALARQCNRLLFCDTDLCSTVLWSHHFFGHCPESVVRLAREQRYDLTLLCQIDVPWVPDPQRDQPHQRHEFLEKFRAAYSQRGVTELNGSHEQRFETACRLVGELLSSRQKGSPTCS